MNKQIITSRINLLKYLELKKIPIKKLGKAVMIQCPFCNQTEKEAMLVPNHNIVNCIPCGKQYNLIDLAIKVENLTGTEDDIIQHLKQLLDIKVMTNKDEEDIDKILDFYEQSGFDLVPIVKNSKKPIETQWTNKEHKNKNEWKQWLVNGLNIGVKTGEKSGILALDIDALSKKQKIEYNAETTSETRRKEIIVIRENNLNKVLKILKSLLGETLIQDSLGGQHYFYKYDKAIPKTHITIEGVIIDIEAEGGYILLYPSKYNKLERKIKEFKPIIEMPKELKKFLLEKTTVPRKTMSEEIREDINTEDFKINPKDFILKNNNLEGICNSSFIKLGGILRKQLNVKQTGYVLHTLNKHLLEDPMPSQNITAMVRELDKYSSFDEQELAHKVLEYLKDVEEANRTEIAMAIAGTNRGEEKKRIDKALKYLVKEGYILKRGTRYSLIQKANWQESLINTGVPVDFKVPYFYDVAEFNWGDMILIGSKNKKGKTHISMNIVKQLVEQGKKPYYISLETGSRFAKIALQLGLKEGDFSWTFCSDPTQIELEPNAITIIDWLMVKDKSKTDLIFMHFTEQLYKTNGMLIVFMQLKEDNSWFAPNMVSQFPSLSTRYIYDNESDGEYGKFRIDVVREPKLHIKTYELPCQYNWETKILKRIDEVEEKKNERK